MFTQQFTDKTGQDFDTYYKKYRPKLVRFLIGIGKDEDDAEDVATEAFVTSLNKIDSYDPTKAVFSTWLFTIAKRIMIQKAREKSKFTSIDMDYDEGFSIGETLSYDDTDYETGHAINYQKSKSIKSIIPTLPEKYATVLTLRHINNKSYQDIAEELGCFSFEVLEKNAKDVRDKLNNPRIRGACRTKPYESKPFEKNGVTKIKFTLAFKYDANKVWDKYDEATKKTTKITGGFIVFEGSDTVKSYEEIEKFLEMHLGVKDIQKQALNLNTVKSRIRQARLLLYRLTKEDFQKLDNLDADKVNISSVYDGYEDEEVELDVIESEF